MSFLETNWLVRWAQLGLLVLLCAPWLVQSNKLYHQLLIVLFYLPAIISLAFPVLRPRLPWPDIAAYLAFAGWTLLVIIFHGGEDSLSKTKVVLYVSLSLLGFILISKQNGPSIEKLLIIAALIAGIGAGLSWINFYCIEGMRLSERPIALGIWDTVIMAAHAVGALAIVGLSLAVYGQWRGIWLLPAMVAALGYLLFLLFSQTRGVWLALLAALAVILLAYPWKIRLGAFFFLCVGVGAVVLHDPDLLLQRGVSYRPDLWSGGLQLVFENPLLGLGFHEFELAISGHKRLFLHPHNLFLDIGIRFGVIGFLLFSLVWLLTLYRAWEARDQPLGRALLALWIFSSVSLMTDGIGLWLKPNADWLITWLPIALGLILARRRHELVLAKA